MLAIEVLAGSPSRLPKPQPTAEVGRCQQVNQLATETLVPGRYIGSAPRMVPEIASRCPRYCVLPMFSQPKVSSQLSRTRQKVRASKTVKPCVGNSPRLAATLF